MFALKFEILMEMWSGKLADYDNLKVFGVVAFANVKKDKLEAQAERCIFITNVEGVKGYKLWRLEPRESRCCMRRDVTFNETRMAICLEIQRKEAYDKVESSSVGLACLEALHDEAIDDENKPSTSHLRKSGRANLDFDYQLTCDGERRMIKPR